MFNVDTLRAEAQHEPFPFVLDGEEHQLPHARTLPADRALLLDAGGFSEVLPDVVGPELAARLMRLEVFALEDLLHAWLRHSGMEPGESSASTDS